MQNHVKVYLEAFGYGQDDWIKCERPECNNRAVDIMHLIPRSKFGKKRKDEQDNILNLFGGCRQCHTAYDDGKKWTLEEMQEIHLYNLSKLI